MPFMPGIARSISEIDTLCAPKNRYRRGAARRLDDAIAERVEHGDGDLPYVVVIDHQHDLAAGNWSVD